MVCRHSSPHRRPWDQQFSIASFADAEKVRAQPPSLRAPAVFGQFEIIRELGQGGFGVVFLANDTKLGRRVALKIPALMSCLTQTPGVALSAKPKPSPPLTTPISFPSLRPEKLGPFAIPPPHTAKGQHWLAG